MKPWLFIKQYHISISDETISSVGEKKVGNLSQNWQSL